MTPFGIVCRHLSLWSSNSKQIQKCKIRKQENHSKRVEADKANLKKAQMQKREAKQLLPPPKKKNILK